jgi:hypothetical protein
LSFRVFGFCFLFVVIRSGFGDVLAAVGANQQRKTKT